MPKVDPIAELSEKLLHALERQRQSGEYPLTAARLAALADPQATPLQVVKALAKKPFAANWLLGHKKDLNSPLAFAEDSERLAESPLLLEFALELLSSAEKPLHSPAKILLKVDKAIRPAFKTALERQIAGQTLPSSVGVLLVRGKPQLHLQCFPLPKAPAEALSEKLLHVLIAQRERGAAAYPAALDRLIEQTGIAPPSAVLKKALATEPFRSRAALALPNQPDSPVALAEDREHLAASPALLHRVLTATRTPATQAVTVAELKKKLAANVRDAFAEAVNRRLGEHVLPEGIGVLRIKNKPLLFLLADLDARPLAPPPEPKPAARDFASLFDAAFARLDREQGSHNHVNLVALRRAVPVERDAFDAGIGQLRRAGRYSLSAAEGRHGLSAEEQHAGIPEDGCLLLFVSRREG